MRTENEAEMERKIGFQKRKPYLLCTFSQDLSTNTT